VDGEIDDYFSSQSTPDMWVEEECKCVPDEGQPGSFWSTSTKLYESYQTWKRNRGEVPLSQTRWAEFMKRSFTAVVSNGIRYKCVRLITDI
jgi:phage/plasmid-associated DNA primase